MSDVTVARTAPFAKLWPWPGLLLLVILAAWFVYMGYIAGQEDVRTAFYGLAGVTGLLVLLALRTIGRRPVVTGNFAVSPASREDRDAVGDRYGDAEQMEVDAMIPAGSDPRDRTAAPRDQLQQTVSPKTANTLRGSRLEELSEEVSNLGSMMTRERADRGAAIKKLESDLRTFADKVSADLETLRQGGTTLRTGGEAGPEADVVTRKMLNAAINQRLMPTIEERINARMAEATEPTRLRELVGTVRPVVDSDAADIKAELASVRELAEQALRQSEVAGVGWDEDKEGAVAAASAQMQELREAEADLRARLEELDKRLEGDSEDTDRPVGQRLNQLRRRIDEVAERAEKGVESYAASLTELRGNVTAVTDHLARMGDHYQDLMRRIENLASSMNGSAAPNLTSEVGAMREALSTIIDQNRQIQERQEALASRLGASAGGAES